MTDHESNVEEESETPRGGDAAALHGHPEEDVKTGERIMESPMTGTVYVVTKWIDKGDGKAVALEKEPLEEEGSA